MYFVDKKITYKSYYLSFIYFLSTTYRWKYLSRLIKKTIVLMKKHPQQKWLWVGSEDEFNEGLT